MIRVWRCGNERGDETKKNVCGRNENSKEWGEGVGGDEGDEGRGMSGTRQGQKGVGERTGAEKSKDRQTGSTVVASGGSYHDTATRRTLQYTDREELKGGKKRTAVERGTKFAAWRACRRLRLRGKEGKRR